MGRGSDWVVQWAMGGAHVGWVGRGVIGRHSGRWAERGREGWGAGVIGWCSGRWVERMWDGWGAGVTGRCKRLRVGSGRDGEV